MVQTVDLGRDAMDRHAWAEAVEAFTAADRDAGLSPADLEHLGTAAWWAGLPDARVSTTRSTCAGSTGGSEVVLVEAVSYALISTR